MRPGTLPTHQILGMATALTLVARHRAADLAHVENLKRHFIDALGARLPVQVHGLIEEASPYILNFSIAGIGSDALINQLARQLAIASGSACSSGALEASYVLRAMGIDGDALYGAVRASFDRNHSLEDILIAVEHIVAAVSRMQELIHN